MLRVKNIPRVNTESHSGGGTSAEAKRLIASQQREIALLRQARSIVLQYMLPAVGLLWFALVAFCVSTRCVRACVRASLVDVDVRRGVRRSLGQREVVLFVDLLVGGVAGWYVGWCACWCACLVAGWLVLAAT